eukprot:CAMPEP_0206056092 /NCGR_PEP_ID=MMETSP1466-20131121/41457_1 /ASSEMBLY_ACC=CAM_ASM_001126 /TAXON_ID=44452 /ORGANISM="Pavlova gyrans, Strain CCMP608" /LENGTH=79 /DNA_ID=CAMNT_0053431323 /DNA_START=1 /DNA_END=237 /DNA_ORIENTATION=+
MPHLVTGYFDARRVNYYNTVERYVFHITAAMIFYEFAKLRGAIHSHGKLVCPAASRAVNEARAEGTLKRDAWNGVHGAS